MGVSTNHQEICSTCWEYKMTCRLWGHLFLIQSNLYEPLILIAIVLVVVVVKNRTSLYHLTMLSQMILSIMAPFCRANSKEVKQYFNQLISLNYLARTHDVIWSSLPARILLITGDDGAGPSGALGRPPPVSVLLLGERQNIPLMYD
jgi:hypothetical protein